MIGPLLLLLFLTFYSKSELHIFMAFIHLRAFPFSRNDDNKKIAHECIHVTTFLHAHTLFTWAQYEKRHESLDMDWQSPLWIFLNDF